MKHYELPQFPVLKNELALSKDQIVGMLERMLTIRFVEQRIAQRVSEKQIATPCHLYIGQEASAVGVCFALTDSDYVFSTHRSHGHFLAKGGKLEELFAEVYCRETGCSGGRGGSMHLCDPTIGLLGSSSIVAGCLGIGLGPALKSKILGETSVSVVFHGDCVPEEGIWHESLNFAAIKQLPVIYVCENNLYAASAGLDERRLYDNIYELAASHGLHTDIVDGNDVFAVNKAAVDAVNRARNGEGPQYIESRTYRWLGHVGPRDDIDVGLRNADELNYWKQRCPIQNLETRLIDQGVVTPKQISDLHEAVQISIDDAERKAIMAQKPDSATILQHIYHREVEP